MATKRPSYLKRQKEQKRTARAAEKREARKQRKEVRPAEDSDFIPGIDEAVEETDVLIP
jgi:hypothetical protein